MGIHDHVGQHVDPEVLAEGVDLSFEKLTTLEGESGVGFVCPKLEVEVALLVAMKVPFPPLRPGTVAPISFAETKNVPMVLFAFELSSLKFLLQGLFFRRDFSDEWQRELFER